MDEYHRMRRAIGESDRQTDESDWDSDRDAVSDLRLPEEPPAAGSHRSQRVTAADLAAVRATISDPIEVRELPALGGRSPRPAPPITAMPPSAEALAFLRRTAMGGSIVSSATMTPAQIAAARAADRMLVTPDGYGFVYVPAQRELRIVRELRALAQDQDDDTILAQPQTDQLTETLDLTGPGVELDLGGES